MAQAANKALGILRSRPAISHTDGMMTTTNTPTIKTSQAYADWLAQYDWHVALTLDYRADGTKAQVERAMSHYWNCIDRKLYGRAAVERGKRLARVASIESGASGLNWHMHAAVRLPIETELCVEEQQLAYTADTLGDMLIREWLKMRESGRHNIAKAISNKHNWLDYICKDENKGIDTVMAGFVVLD